MSHVPLTNDEIELIRLEADRHSKVQADETLRLIADLRAARNRVMGAEAELSSARAESARLTAERDEARQRLEGVREDALRSDSAATRAWQRAEAADARLAAVIALCDERWSGPRAEEQHLNAIRAAATGEQE